MAWFATNSTPYQWHQNNHFPETLTNLIEDDYAQVVWFDWWNSDAVRAFETQHNLRVEHANWSENFAFNRVTSVPTGEAEPIFIEDLSEDMFLRQYIGDGNLGGLYQINDQLMFQLLDGVVDEVVQLLIQLRPDR